MKKCPFCAEEIQDDAIECLHCGSGHEENIATDTVILKPAADYGMFLLAIPVIACVLIWFWVSGMNLLQSPGSSLSLIMVATVLGTALVAAMEASKVGVKSNREKGIYSPTAWFFLITLLWIICYPVYLFKRKHFGLANRLPAGIIIALIFVWSWCTMNYAIEGRKAEIRGNLEHVQQQLGALPAAPGATDTINQVNEQVETNLPVSNETVSQQNAVKSAKNYLSYTAFSHDGLVVQLEYEQFSHADAVYGADNSGANWNEQAAKKAKEYMTQSAFSRGSLITQLKYEKFTQKQAVYGAHSVGL